VKGKIAIVSAALVFAILIGTASASPWGSAITIQHTYTFSIGPGKSWAQYSYLNDDVYGSTTGTGYADKFVMTVTAKTKLHIEVVDCCLMGDTIACGISSTKYKSATSPQIVIIDATLDASTRTFYVGYIKPHTGVFPAGYDIYVTGSAP